MSRSETFGYDALNRLTQSQVGSLTAQTYAYDAIGNLLQKPDVGTYTYGGTAGPHAVTKTAGRIAKTYRYDAKGNQIGRFDTAGVQVAILNYTSFDKPSLHQHGRRPALVGLPL
jgi:YD repeat-containing protein